MSWLLKNVSMILLRAIVRHGGLRVVVRAVVGAHSTPAAVNSALAAGLVR